MQLPSAGLILVLVLVQFTWTVLSAVVVRETLQTAHIALLCTAIEATQRMQE